MCNKKKDRRNLKCIKFVQVKFINNPMITLAYVDKDSEKYDTTICGVVTKGCNLSKDIDAMEWWETYGKTITHKKINILRNDTIKCIKDRFYGKSIIEYCIL